MHLSAWRKKHSMTLAQTAKFFGLPNATTVRRYEKRIHLPRAEVMHRFFIRSGGAIKHADWYTNNECPK